MKTRRTDRAFIERAERDDDLAALVRGVISVAIHEPDFSYAQALCIRLSAHRNFNVRGNAIQAMGHLIRMHGRLDEPDIRPILETGLQDESEYVRSQAEEVRDESARVLAWQW